MTMPAEEIWLENVQVRYKLHLVQSFNFKLRKPDDVWLLDEMIWTTGTVQHATSDIMTYAIKFLEQAARELKRECGLTLVQYRMTSYLHDHPDGSSPSALASILGISPAMATTVISQLKERNLVFVVQEDNGRTRLKASLTKAGVDLSRDADIALMLAHESYFSPLSPNLRAMVVVGSEITASATQYGNRIREGHFFDAFETLHELSFVEFLFTKLAREFGLQINEMRIVFALIEEQRNMRPSELSDKLLLAAPKTTYALNALSEKGIIESAADPTDRRAKLVMIAPEKIPWAQQLADAVEEFYKSGIRSGGQAEWSAYHEAAFIITSALRRKKSRGAQEKR